MNKLSQKPSNLIRNTAPRQPEFSLVSFHFVYADNGKHSASNHLIFKGSSFKNGTFSGKMERKWNTPTQKRNGTEKQDNPFTIKDLLPTNGTKSGTKWNAWNVSFLVFQYELQNKTCVRMPSFEKSPSQNGNTILKPPCSKMQAARCTFV